MLNTINPKTILSAIIIDDEINGAEALSILLREYCPDIKVIAVETDPLKAINKINKFCPNVLFLDIDMPGMSGFELLTELKEPLPKVIFTTAHSQYAVKAFRHNAIDYLLKPIIADELIASVNKLIQSADTNLPKQHLKNNTPTITTLNSVDQKISVQSQNEIIHVTMSQIIWLKADSNYTHIHMMGGRRLTSSKTLKEYEDQLIEYNFFRVHKMSLINTLHIDKYIRGETPFVIMKDQTRIEVSRRKKADFLMSLYREKIS